MEYQIRIKNAGGNLAASAYPPYQSKPPIQFQDGRHRYFLPTMAGG